MKKELFRKELAGFQSYVPGKSAEEVQEEYGLTEIAKLASNENQFGPSPKAVEAVCKAASEINYYPDPFAFGLRKALGVKLNVKPENIVVGSGGEEMISIIAHTFLNAGDEVVMADPTFGIYQTTALLLGAKPVSVSYKNCRCDVNGMVNAVTDKTKLFYLCSPNNPTGDILTDEDLDYVFSHVPEDVVIIIDEAYYEFAKENPAYPDSLKRLEKRENVVVLRTFSKVCGLAGVRVGYVITSPVIAGEMGKVKQTFNVNRLAQAAALGALQDEEHIQKTVAGNARSLDMLYEFFTEMQYEYIPSNANFVFVNVHLDSALIFEELQKRGVIVRPGCAWGWKTWLRVSTGTEEQTQMFIRRMREIAGTYGRE